MGLACSREPGKSDSESESTDGNRDSAPAYPESAGLGLKTGGRGTRARCSAGASLHKLERSRESPPGHAPTRGSDSEVRSAGDSEIPDSDARFQVAGPGVQLQLELE
jgi:hypothetical protein